MEILPQNVRVPGHRFFDIWGYSAQLKNLVKGFGTRNLEITFLVSKYINLYIKLNFLRVKINKIKPK